MAHAGYKIAFELGIFFGGLFGFLQLQAFAGIEPKQEKYEQRQQADEPHAAQRGGIQPGQQLADVRRELFFFFSA